MEFWGKLVLEHWGWVGVMAFGVWGGVDAGVFAVQGSEEAREKGIEGERQGRRQGRAQLLVHFPEGVDATSYSPLTGFRRKI